MFSDITHKVKLKPVYALSKLEKSRLDWLWLSGLTLPSDNELSTRDSILVYGLLGTTMLKIIALKANSFALILHFTAHH